MCHKIYNTVTIKDFNPEIVQLVMSMEIVKGLNHSQITRTKIVTAECAIIYRSKKELKASR